MNKDQMKAESLPTNYDIKNKVKRTIAVAPTDLTQDAKHSALIDECSTSIHFDRIGGIFLKNGNETILRLPQVKALTGLSRTSIYSMMTPASPYFDATFPKNFKLNPAGAPNSAVGWYHSEVLAWVLARKASEVDSGVMLSNAGRN